MDKNLSKSYLGNVDISASEIEEMDLEVTHSEGSQLITFILGDEKYGMEILKVRELISHPEGLTRIPGMPDFIVGMFNLRGLVIPVMDLREKFGMPSQEVNQFSVIIIVQVESKDIGLIVDSVADVILKGIAKTKNEMVILLDIDYLLAKEEFDSLIQNDL